ncbi:uncharacterized protein G2W53_019047 [Senna tora]|uniref:Uncharacterized protein n=1 Tax=Senna tora TaxID=362788 RepID=A0A834WNW4_9FABA|nr:uncharacterized protein G2W53_019047 [Senna tora]
MVIPSTIIIGVDPSKHAFAAKMIQ